MLSIIRLFICLAFAWLLVGCNLKKVSKVSITNKNNFSISVDIIANNLKHSQNNIGANAKTTGNFDFTNLIGENGTFLITVTNNNTGIVDTFNEGHFIDGNLTNYMNLVISNGSLTIEYFD